LLIVSSVASAGRHVHLSEAALAHWKRGADVGWTGVDATTRATLLQAAARGCDFALVSPVLAADPGDGAPLGWHGVRALLRQAPLPVFARGGLTSGDLATAQAAGAHGIALPLAQWAHMHARGAS
jgi:8-oxo-dGTP diphosphatase